MEIVWLDLARDDLAAIRVHIAGENPAAAVAVARRLLDAIEKLAEYPHIGRVGRVPETRELVIAGTPYIAPYRVRNGRIEILRVFHGAKKWPGSF